MRLSRFYLTASLALALPLCGQPDPESFHLEVTAGAWVRNASGTIQSGVTPVDLQADLGIEQNQPQFFGALVFKPARRHRLIVEGSPYRLSGNHTAVRQFTFGGQTYTVADQLASSADISYVFGGYQFDAVSNPRGHFGLQGGVAYVDATGTVRSQTSGFTGTLTQSFPFPVAGTEFRLFLIPGSALLNVNGGVKGMALGSYGHFVEGAINAGVGLGRHVTLQAGYLLVDADVHRKDQTRGFTPRFTGPLFSVQLRM